MGPSSGIEVTLLRILFFVVWFATIGVRIFLTWKLIRLHLVSSYPWFTSFIIISTVETCARMYAGFTGGGRAYNEAWARWQWLTLLMMAGLLVECFVLHAKHFRRFAVAGTVSAGVLTLIALAIWMPTADLEKLARPDAPVLTKATRDLSTVGFILLSLTSMFFSMFGRNWIRPNVREHAAVLQWFFFLTACGYFVRGGVLKGQWFGVVSAFIVTGGSLYCYVRWMLRITSTGEQWQRPAPVNDELIEKLERKRRLLAKAGMR